jgi:hypothetical protein
MIMKIKIVESASTMPPMGSPTPKKKKPKPMAELPKVDRKTHYKKHQKSVRRIVDGWFNKNVLGASGAYNIDLVLSAIQNDETLMNRLDHSVKDGYISERTSNTIMKLANGDQTTIDMLKKEIKMGPRQSTMADDEDEFDLEDDDDMPSVDTGASTFRFDMLENISINVLEHLKSYMYLFASESWYGIDYSAAKEALFGTPSMVKRDLIEAALEKWLTEGWTPMKSAMGKAKYMKDYDMDRKWPEHVYSLRENKQKIKVKIV